MSPLVPVSRTPCPRVPVRGGRDRGPPRMRGRPGLRLHRTRSCLHGHFQLRTERRPPPCRRPPPRTSTARPRALLPPVRPLLVSGHRITARDRRPGSKKQVTMSTNGTSPAVPPTAVTPSRHPARLTAVLDAPLSRGLWLTKWPLALPPLRRPVLPAGGVRGGERDVRRLRCSGHRRRTLPSTPPRPRRCPGPIGPCHVPQVPSPGKGDGVYAALRQTADAAARER